MVGRGKFVSGLTVVVLLLSGCAGPDFVSVRKVPRNPLASTLQLFSRGGPQSTPRTDQLVRRYGLEGEESDSLLGGLQAEIESEPAPEKLYAFAELSYIEARKALALNRESDALEHYGDAVAHAYWYLFDPRFDRFRNPYDPQFRGACDLYNSALEGALRIANKYGRLHPGSDYSVTTTQREFRFSVEARGPWHAEDFARFEFVTDFEVNGLENRHHTYGLGVPLIVVRNHHPDEDPAERYYPPGLSFAATAFLRVAPRQPGGVPDHEVHCVLELHDPITAKDIHVAGRSVPLETDLSTPLAYFLDNPEFEKNRAIATLALLRPELAQPLRGLYMLEPYDPNKIPVLLVHGLWSSPITWMEMFNDLRSFPEVRDQYQFWFYLYPTGQPFWVSGAQLREDLAAAFGTLDPRRRSPALNQMVLVGHSMGGLVSRLQTIDSRDDFWRILSDRPFEELRAEPEERERLARLVFFEPNPAIRRVVTIGTPHRGSEFANDYTRWLGRKLIDLPEVMVRFTQKLVRDNPTLFRDTELLSINTSIDSLAPDSPILPVMETSERAPWTTYHNIVGIVPQEGFVARLTGEGDGVVSVESARVEDAVSEIAIEADHGAVHRHPRSILEIRRILLEHQQAALAEMRGQWNAVPASYEE